jgi:hypothetical protein
MQQTNKNNNNKQTKFPNGAKSLVGVVRANKKVKHVVLQVV